jgi:CheY-like chemotaxis protein
MKEKGMHQATLHIEDDAILAMGLQRMLSQLGYTVTVPLATSEETLTCLSDRQADWLLTDIRSPRKICLIVFPSIK